MPQVRKIIVWTATAVLLALTAGVAAQGRIELPATDKGRALGIGKLRVERTDKHLDAEVLDADDALIGRVTLAEDVAALSTAIFENAKTGEQVQVRYSEGYRLVEISVNGVTERAEIATAADGKAEIKQSPGFEALRLKHAKHFDLLGETLTTIEAERTKQKAEPEKKPSGYIKAVFTASSCTFLNAQISRPSCSGRNMRGRGYDIAKSQCCQKARQDANNQCTNFQCWGCCWFGECDSICMVGSYFCPQCGITGRSCSYPGAF